MTHANQIPSKAQPSSDDLLDQIYIGSAAHYYNQETIKHTMKGVMRFIKQLHRVIWELIGLQQIKDTQHGVLNDF